jgi:pilus assembly protein CpaE
VESFAAVTSGIENLPFDVAVVESDGRMRTRLALELANAAQYGSIEELAQSLRPTRPTVGVFGPGFVSEYGFQQVHRLTGAHPELGAVFAVSELSTEVLQQALRSGARDAVVLDSDGSVRQSVDRVGQLLVGSLNRSTASSVSPEDLGRLIVVLSTKGGVGKTVIAINLAVAMARCSANPVALVDADVQFGDVAVMLGLPPDRTLLDAAAAVHYGDHDMVAELMIRHEGSGLLVLPAPIESAPSDTVLPGEIVAVCEALLQSCGHVIVDVPAAFTDHVLAVVEAADDVLLVGSMDIPSIKNLKIGIQAYDLVAVAGPKLRLVLNHANARVKLDVKEIERVLGLSAEFAIPNDLAVPMAVNAGEPFVSTAPRAPVTRAIERLADVLMGDAARSPRRRRDR